MEGYCCLFVSTIGYFLSQVRLASGKSSAEQPAAMTILCSVDFVTLTRQHPPSMAQLCPRAISDLATAQTTHDQITAAKHIKNALVGHPTNKETFVRHGLVDVLAQILSAYSGRDRTIPDNGSALSGEEEVVLQALVLLRSIVKGLAREPF